MYKERTLKKVRLRILINKDGRGEARMKAKQRRAQNQQRKYLLAVSEFPFLFGGSRKGSTQRLRERRAERAGRCRTSLCKF